MSSSREATFDKSTLPGLSTGLKEKSHKSGCMSKGCTQGAKG